MRNRLLICMSLLFGVIEIQAQQRPQYSQYMLNNFLLNPAVAGTTDHIDLRAGYRSQWMGFKDSQTGNSIAPQSFYLSAIGHLGAYHGPNKGHHRNDSKRHHGIGLLAVNDVTGPTARTSVYGSYALNMKISQTFRLSVGAFLGFQQWRLDADKLIYRNPSETGVASPAPAIGSSSKVVPDGSLGVWLYDKNLYVGASMHQIFQSKLAFNDYLGGVGQGQLSNHYFFTAGYKFQINKEFAVIPSTLIKMVSPSPLSFDINTKVRYRDMLWAGVSYRSDKSFVTLVGVVIKEMVEIGYSYDYTTSAIGKFDTGSHEIMVGVKIKPHGQVYSPSDFW